MLGWLATWSSSPRGSSACFQGGHALGVRLRTRKQTVLSPSCLTVLTRLCPHTGRNDNYSYSCLLPLRGTQHSQVGKDMVLFSLVPSGYPAKALASTGGLGTVAEWPKMKS